MNGCPNSDFRSGATENSVLMAILLMIFMTTHNWRSKVDVSRIFTQDLPKHLTAGTSYTINLQVFLGTHLRPSVESMNIKSAVHAPPPPQTKGRGCMHGVFDFNLQTDGVDVPAVMHTFRKILSEKMG